MAKYSEAQKRATTKWNKENLERIYLTVHKGVKGKIQARAEELGKSVNKYIEDLILQDLEG